MTRTLGVVAVGLLLAACGSEGEQPAAATARGQATPTQTPTPTPTPTPVPTDTVRLRPPEGGRGSGRIDVDRASGSFEIRLERMEPIGRRRAFAVWVRRARPRPACRLGFLAPPHRGAIEASGQLPKLPARTRFLVTVERSQKPRRPGRVVLRGRAGFPIDSATAAGEVCRRS